MGFVYDLSEKRGEEFIWRKMTNRDQAGPWTLADVDWSPKDVTGEYLRRLIKAGFVEQVGERDANPPSKVKAKLYRIKTQRQAAPRVSRDGRELPERMVDTLWRTMKMLKRFTAKELAAHATSDKREIKPSTAERYARELASAGILTRTGGREASYVLVLNIGASAPRVLRHHLVFDPNKLAILRHLPEGREVFE